MANRKLRSFKFALASVCSLLLVQLTTGCASTNSQKTEAQSSLPSWVTAPPAGNGDIIYAVGSASVDKYQPIATLQQQADDSARLEIAKQLSVEISGATDVYQQDKNGTYQSEVYQHSRAKVDNFNLAGVTIIQRYQDDSRNTLYALASFSRQAALNELNAKRINLDQQLAQLQLEYLNNPADVSSDLKVAYQVKRVQQQYQAIVRQQKRIDASVDGVRPATMDYFIAADNLLSRQLYGLVDGDNDAYQALLLNRLAEAGLQAQLGDGVFGIRYTIEQNHRVQENRHYQLLSAELSITLQNRVITAFTVNAKGVATDKQSAQIKALQALANISVQTMQLKLAEHFNRTNIE